MKVEMFENVENKYDLDPYTFRWYKRHHWDEAHFTFNT